ncbi:MAG TPA: sporulation protein YhbH [Candidatus Binataceae bacterium]|nr:sporulation protein YhbH [Candidatus Binataceae bacterium]
MATDETIFREYRPSESERSDRSAGDRLRHRQKVRESIRENIADIIAEESIIGKDKDRVIKVPIRGIKEYRFIYGENAPGASQGSGDSRPGQVVGKTGKEGQGKGDDVAGDRPGVDYYETDVTLEELIEIMFEDLELPNLERKALREIQSEYSTKRKGYRHVGIRVRLDKRRTAKQRVMRMLASQRSADNARALDEQASAEDAPEAALSSPQALSGGGAALKRASRRFPFHQDDLRYKHVETDIREESNAAVICIMDTSGSMDTMKKYLARSFFFLLYQFISTRYRNVEIVFIAHHTEAREVTEEEFFHKGESGGTFISSGYQKALEIIAERYHPSLWNVYAFHCSDGDNFDSDNTAALKAAEQLAEVCNLFGYGEIKPLGSRYYESSMLNLFRRLQEPNFHTVLIERKEDIWPSFKAFLAKDRVKE